MPRASAHDSGTVGSSTAQGAKPAVSGKAYSVSEMFADGLGNGSRDYQHTSACMDSAGCGSCLPPDGAARSAGRGGG